jgi:Asp-tRNA(Asn)/Glu-tRNA(Gln) amidotransferase A subunit family amidase
MKTYISGAITGTTDYMERFEKAEQLLKAQGREVVNPTKLPHNHDKTWESYMREDIKALVECEAIYVMKGWSLSKGAILEVNIASALEFKIEFEE